MICSTRCGTKPLGLHSRRHERDISPNLSTAVLTLLLMILGIESAIAHSANWDLLILPFDKVLEHARPRRMPQLPERFDFYLPNALSSDLKVFAHLFQSPFTALGVQSKPQADNLFLSWAQGLEHITGNVTQVGSDHSFGRTDR